MQGVRGAGHRGWEWQDAGGERGRTQVWEGKDAGGERGRTRGGRGWMQGVRGAGCRG